MLARLSRFANNIKHTKINTSSLYRHFSSIPPLHDDYRDHEPRDLSKREAILKKQLSEQINNQKQTIDHYHKQVDMARLREDEEAEIRKLRKKTGLVVGLVALSVFAINQYKKNHCFYSDTFRQVLSEYGYTTQQEQNGLILILKAHGFNPYREKQDHETLKDWLYLTFGQYFTFQTRYAEWDPMSRSDTFLHPYEVKELTYYDYFNDSKKRMFLEGCKLLGMDAKVFNKKLYSDVMDNNYDKMKKLFEPQKVINMNSKVGVQLQV